MNLHITGHHVQVSPAIREYVGAKLERVTRHFDHLIDVKSGQVIEFNNPRIEALQEEIARERTRQRILLRRQIVQLDGRFAFTLQQLFHHLATARHGFPCGLGIEPGPHLVAGSGAGQITQIRIEPVS